MNKHWLYIIFLGFFFISSPMNSAHAHGGHKKPAVEVKEPGGSIYAVGEKGAESSQGEEGGFPLSRSDIFANEIPLTPDAMEHMNHQPSGAMDHTMPEIEIAKREWVSPKQKGYGVAVGITIFAGLIFGVLSFKRPLE